MRFQPFVRSAYNYDQDEASVEAGLLCADESLAIQSQRDEADINTIVRRFGITGQLPVGLRLPTFGDFDEVFDFQSAQNALVEADRAFMAVPAEIRMRFGNDPQRFVEFCSDEKNLPELRKLGLAVPEVVAEPEKVMKVEVINKEGDTG